MFTGLLCGSMC